MHKPQARLAAAILAILSNALNAQTQTQTMPAPGLVDAPNTEYAITGASVWMDGAWRDGLTVTIRGNRIVDVSAKAARGVTRIDATGKALLPGFIEMVSDWGAGSLSCNYSAEPPAAGGRRRRGMMSGAPAETPTQGQGAKYWNPMVCAEQSVADAISLDAERAKTMRSLGFTVVNAAPNSGVWRGQSAVLALRPDGTPNNALLKRDVLQAAALERTSPFSGNYPASLMGAIALTRQSLLDARWYQQSLDYARRDPSAQPEMNAALAALVPVTQGQQTVLWRSNDELDLARIGKLDGEFNLKSIIVGTGREYREMASLRKIDAVVVPLVFPDVPKVEDPETAMDISLADLQHWKAAPFNPMRVAESGVQFALTSDGLDKPAEQFLSRLRLAIKSGLSEADALKALTTTPAQMLGMKNELGQIAVGQYANLLIADKDWLSKDSGTLFEVWVSGQRSVLKDLENPDFKGNWSLKLADGSVKPFTIESVDGSSLDFAPKSDDGAKPAQAANAESPKDGGEKTAEPKKGAPNKDALGKVNAKIEGERVLVYAPKSLIGGELDTVIFSAILPRDAEGKLLESPWELVSADGRTRLTATRTGDLAAKTDKPMMDDAKASVAPALGGYPAGEFTRASVPKAPAAVVFRSVTVWLPGVDANGQPLAPLAETDVLLRNGVIAAVGKNLAVPAGATEIDAKGKHLSPGLIDAHSHIAVEGDVNEGTHTVTSEVRIADTLDPTDINIYRQLAAGVTTSHLMHGSANAIGGQSQVIKLRWGASADGLKFAEAAPTIKFALGENPKQANWGDNFVTRYPQTRMGVEQIIRDSFTRAENYAERADDKLPRRRDLRLEALVEVLEQQRMLHVHSYRQDEILMFARMMQAKKVPIAAFQHVLEGYKVADVLAEVGAGASTFADWWAFKVEVQDAIPHNAAMMMRAGVVTSLNSDSPDLARRLNTEAAKTLRFGGLTPSQALALVTLFPAKQLRVDKLVGSIEVGKQGDLVLWSKNPLSTLARVEQTWIDGAKYFDLAEHALEQAQIDVSRQKLVQEALSKRVDSMGKGGPGGPPGLGRPGGPPKGLTQASFYSFARNAWSTELSSRRGSYHDGQPAHQCRVSAWEVLQ